MQDDDQENKIIDVDKVRINVKHQAKPILSPTDRIKIEISIKKKNILLMCYKVLYAISKDHENSQLFLSMYMPLMQMHSFFFPQVIQEIAKLFSGNQEVLLKLKKKSKFLDSVLDHTGITKANGFKLIDLNRMNEEIAPLLASFYQTEGISSGASNIFYFFCYYLMKTDSVEVRQEILDLLTQFSKFNGEGINSNQEEIYTQIKMNFKDLLRNQFYTMSSRDKDLVVLNPSSLRAEKIVNIFAASRKKATAFKLDSMREVLGRRNTKTIAIADAQSELASGGQNTDERQASNIDNKTIPLPFEDGFDSPDEEKQKLKRPRNNEESLGAIQIEEVVDFTEESARPQIGFTSPKRDLLFDENPMDYHSSRDRAALTERSRKSTMFQMEQKWFILIQLDFYAAMCLDRNYIWKGILEQNGFFNFEVLLENFTKLFEFYEVNASLTRVLHEMYVDRQSLYYTIVPQLAKTIGYGQAFMTSSSPTKNRAGMYSLMVQPSDANIVSIQEKINFMFDRLNSVLESLPDTFEELNDESIYERYVEQTKIICNSFTLELVKLVNKIFSFGHYILKPKGDQAKYTTVILRDPTEEADLAPLLRIMVKILEFEPDYPETKFLIASLRSAVKKWSAEGKDKDSIVSEMKKFKYAEQYDKVLMVEDVEHKEDDAFNIYEAYFRQYLAKDIAFKNHFKKNNKVFEQIKYHILGIIQKAIDQVTDSYANRAVEVFERVVLENDLDAGVMAGAYSSSPGQIVEAFKAKLSSNKEFLTPPIAKTGLSLDILDEKLNDNQEQTSFDINHIIGHSLFPSLLLLFTFNKDSDELSSKSIELLIKIFSQRVHVKHIIDETIIVHGNKDVKEFERVRKEAYKLIDYCDRSEDWIRSPDVSIMKENITDVVSTLDWFCRMISDDVEENVGHPDIVNRDTFNVNPEAQDLFRSLKVQETVVDFLRDTSYILSEVYDAANDPKIVFYFQALYLFLRKFCHKNLRNQQLLSQQISVFLQDSRIEVGQASLIIEIYKDNEMMCRTMQSLVTDDFIRWILKYGRRERFIDFFINLMKCNDNFLVDNQRKILALFIDHPRKNDLLFCTPQEKRGDDKIRRHELNFQPKVNLEDRLYSDEPYSYHSKILRLLTYSCAGKSGVYVNEIKVRNLFSLEYLVGILFIEDSFLDQEENEKHFFADKSDEEHSEEESNFKKRTITFSPFLKKRNLSPDQIPGKSIIKLQNAEHRNGIDSQFDSGIHTPAPEHAEAHGRVGRPGLSHLHFKESAIQDDSKKTPSMFPPINKSVSSPKQKKKKVSVPRRSNKRRTTLLKDLQNGSSKSKKYFNSLKISIIELIYFVYFETTTVSDEVIELRGQFVNLFVKEMDRLRKLNVDVITPDYVEYLFGNLLRMAAAVNGALLKEKSDSEEADESNKEFKMIDFINEFANKVELFDDTVLVKYTRELQAASKSFNFDFGERVQLASQPRQVQSEDELIVDAPKEVVYRYLWKKFRVAYSESEDIKEQINNEKIVLSKSLNQIEDIFKVSIIENPGVESSVKKIMINLNKKRVIKSIIGFVNENANEKSRKPIICEVLYCLGGMIPLNKDGNVTEDIKAIVRDEQQFLEKCGATDMIMKQLTNQLTELKTDDFTINLLRFAIRLLEGGNEIIQTEFYSFMKNESSSEIMYSKIYYLFVKETEYINKGIISLDLTIVQMVLELIQHFAEGHYNDLQLYMRIQTNSMRSYNLLEEVVNLLTAYVEGYKVQYYPLILQCFDTITELIQGPCFSNQHVLMQGRIMETVIKILSIDEFFLMECQKNGLENEHSRPGMLKPWMVAKIKHKCSIMLISLIECRQDNSILTKMHTNLKKYLYDNIISFYINFKEIYGIYYTEEGLEHVEAEPVPDDPKSEMHCSVIIQTAFHFYTIIRNNQEAEDEAEDSSNEDEDDSESLEGIEELAQAQEKIKEEPPAPMMDFKLMNQTDLKRYMDVERVKAKPAALKFMREKTRSLEVIRQDEKLERVYFLTVPYFEAINDNIKDEFNQEVSRVSCKTKCNDLLEVSEELIFKLKRERKIIKKRELRFILNNYNTIKYSSYFFVLIINLLSLVWYRQGRIVEEDKIPVDKTNRSIYVTQQVLGIIVVLHAVVILSFDLYREIPTLKIIYRREKAMGTFKYFIFERALIFYYLVYIGVGVIGVIIPAWFTFHLNDILNINTILRNIVKSVWRPKVSMVLTLILFVVILYAFAAVGFVYFSEAYKNSMPGLQPCQNIFQCFLLTFDKGFKFDGGIGNYLTDHNEFGSDGDEYRPVDVPRFVFENLLLIFDLIIILNIVSGIIIDTFGSLREEYNAYIEDTETYCFICGEDRETLDKESGEKKEGFEYHVKNEHYQWNYLFYIGYIRDKEKTEYTGLESHIEFLIKKEDISWFPNHRAIMIKEDDGLEAGEAVDEDIKDIQEDQQRISKLTETLKKDLVAYQNRKEAKAEINPDANDSMNSEDYSEIDYENDNQESMIENPIKSTPRDSKAADAAKELDLHTQLAQLHLEEDPYSPGSP